MNNLNNNLAIKSALDRMVDVYQKKPQTARSTSAITGLVEDGLACTISDGNLTVVADLPGAMGGNDSGPTPGFYARAGIAGCVSMGIKMMGAHAGHDFRSVKVTVETDFDDRAMFGLCDDTAAPIETRVGIEVDSDLDEAELKAFVEDVLEHDTWFLGLRDRQLVKTQINGF